MAERLSTGIPGLDEMTGGGFIKGDTILVTGPPGTGKTTFGLQFLISGIRQGENGVYVTVEETPEKIAADALNFGWDLRRMEAEGRLKVLQLQSDMLQAGGSPILQCIKTIRDTGAKRIVVDPISLYSINVQGQNELRRELYAFVNYMKANGVTLLLTMRCRTSSTGSPHLRLRPRVHRGQYHHAPVRGNGVGNEQVREHPQDARQQP